MALMVSWGENERLSICLEYVNTIFCSIGPVDLTVGSLFPEKNSGILTVTHNLFKHGAIATELVSVSFEPTTVPSVKNGELTFGRTDSTRFTGPFTYVYVLCGYLT